MLLTYKSIDFQFIAYFRCYLGLKVKSESCTCWCWGGWSLGGHVPRFHVLCKIWCGRIGVWNYLKLISLSTCSNRMQRRGASGWLFGKELHKYSLHYIICPGQREGIVFGYDLNEKKGTFWDITGLPWGRHRFRTKTDYDPNHTHCILCLYCVNLSPQNKGKHNSIQTEQLTTGT